MSKAVTNEEVEDVLSSIRRLVSEDKRPLAGLRSAPVAAPEVDAPEINEDLLEDGDAQDHPPAAEPVHNQADHFVLTPALRVLTPVQDNDDGAEDDGAEDNGAHDDVADEGPLDLGSVARETWSNDADDVEEVALDDADGAEDNAPMMLFPAAKLPAKDAAMDALDALVHAAIENEVKAIEDEIDEGDYADEGFWDDVEDDAPLSDADARDDHAHQDDAVEVEDHHDGESPSDLQEDAADHDPSDADVEDDAPIEEAPFFDGEAEAGPRFSDDTPEQKSPYIPLTAKIAALEAVIGGRTQDYEPDGDEADTLASPDAPAMAWEDDVELDAKGEPFVAPVEEVEEHAPESEPTQPNPAFAADDQVMDEEALRDLVSEIVRAELQGALGERITRNVRKLVRREIHRALTAQEME